MKQSFGGNVDPWSDNDVLTAIPSIKNKLDSGWMIYFYEEFETQIFRDEVLRDEFKLLIAFCQMQPGVKSFRREVSPEDFPFLCAVRVEEKALYIGTRRLGRELALIKLFEANPFSNSVELEKRFFKLQSHVEKISSIPLNQLPTEHEFITFKNQLPQLLEREQWKLVDDEARLILKQLTKKVGEYRSSWFEKLSDYGLNLTAQFDVIRLHLLKFLALLPSLDYDRLGLQVKRNLIECLRRLKEDSARQLNAKKRGQRGLPIYLKLLFSLALAVCKLLPAPFLAALVRTMVKSMARRFIAGESIVDAQKTMRELKHSQRYGTLDQLGELVVSSREADEYFEKVLQLIHGLKHHIPRGEKNNSGIYSAHVSIKVSALCHDFKPYAWEDTYSKVAPRLKRILLEAQREEVFINIDAEHYHYRDQVFRIYARVLRDTPELRSFEQTGIVLQAYLRDASEHFQEILNLAKSRNLRMPIRLVKGAYWDAETVEAEAHQFSAPQFLNKEESDLQFRQLAILALEHGDFISLAIGSHNLQDHAFVEALRKVKYPSAPVIEHQCLHMTYEALSHGLALMGWPTRNYMPIGNLLVGMAYLVRRIMENSSQVGVLSMMRSHKKSSHLMSSIDILLQKKKNHQIVQDQFISQLSSDFFPVRPSRLFMTNDLKRLETSMEHFSNLNLNPSLSDFANANEVGKCVLDLSQNFSTHWWSKPSSVLARVAIFLKAADLMLLQRNQLAALIMFESGKTMVEALADVDEAIDFINYYTRQESSLFLSSHKVQARGVLAVIAPWNFPLAIPCGMTVAPLLAGNFVLLKPAEQTPLIADKMAQILFSAGVPQTVFKLLQGDGENVGAPLVNHPHLAGVVFTGSKHVGDLIYRGQASSISQGPLKLQKKIITEMGGKNAIIVTNNCEMDETISGILYAAFGHAGQKCSAASRVLVHRDVKESLVNRLKEAVRDIKVGPQTDPATSINPLISREEQLRVRSNIEEAKDEAIRSGGKIIIDRSFEKLPGNCVGPAVLEIPSHQARKRESWAQREIFGPVIHIIQFDNLMEAVELFNSTEYALTGGVYAQSQDDIDFLLRFLKAGNLYVNRPNTGARVAIEPFGGFKLSGTGPKAGGKDYLLQFHTPISTSPFNVTSEFKFSSSSGYRLDQPRSSLIGVNGRLTRFISFADDFLKHFESLTGHVSEKEKNDLLVFINWIKENLPSYLNSRHMNFLIPGQLSYNDKSLIRDAGIFVQVKPFPSHKCLIYLMGALALGSGLNVVCVTHEAYSTWKLILDLIWKAGFAKSNIDITLCSPEDLRLLLRRSCYSYIFAESMDECYESLYQDILHPDALRENMRLVLSDLDGNFYPSASDVLDNFIWQRSLAINTMRHGAPLEMNL